MSSEKRHRQREARERRKLPPAELLKLLTEPGYMPGAIPWNLGAGDQRKILTLVGGDEDLSGLAEMFPDDLAVAEVRAQVIVVRADSAADEHLGRALKRAVDS